MAIVHKWTLDGALTDSVGSVNGSMASGGYIAVNNPLIPYTNCLDKNGEVDFPAIPFFNAVPPEFTIGFKFRNKNVSNDTAEFQARFNGGSGGTAHMIQFALGNNLILGESRTVGWLYMSTPSGYEFGKKFILPSNPAYNTWHSIAASYIPSNPAASRVKFYYDNMELVEWISMGNNTLSEAMAITSGKLNQYNDNTVDVSEYVIYNTRAYLPVITEINPLDSFANGSLITITGTSLNGLTPVLYIDDVDYSSEIIASSSTEITFSAPDLVPGDYVLYLKNGDFESERFLITYPLNPTIASITPFNEIQKNTSLTISGTDLEGFTTTALLIGGVDYTASITSSSATEIIFTSPDLPYGVHHVVVVVDGIESDPFSIFYSLKVVYGNPPSGDIKISVTSPEWGDIVLNPDNKSELVLDDGLENYVSILLFSNRRADDSDIIPDGSPDRQGFWGDTLLGFSLGSKLWELQRMSIGNKLIVQAKQFAEDALKILIDEGIADSVSVDVTKNPNNKNELVFKVLIIKLDKGSIGYSYYYNWKNQMTRKAS